jgi:5-formyltetrahydrofolate cyclo-ligase
MPTPRLREGFLLLDPTQIPSNRWFAASSIRGALSLAQPVGLDNLPTPQLLVVGSVAVTTQGDRVGKGEGYAELEFATLRTLNRIPPDIPIATTVHDAQLVDELPREPFDVSLDLICTPTRIVRCPGPPRRPPGVLWAHLPAARRAEMPILDELFHRQP